MPSILLSRSWGEFASGRLNNYSNRQAILLLSWWHHNSRALCMGNVGRHERANVNNGKKFCSRFYRCRIIQECGPQFLPSLVKSFTDTFTKYLGTSWPEEIVCYALGRFSTPTDWGRSCKLQLILLCELAEKLHVSPMLSSLFLLQQSFFPETKIPETTS